MKKNGMNAKYCKEDEELFKNIYQKYHYPIFINIRKIVSDEHSAEDIFQDVFVSLWENLHIAGTKKTVADWLFTVSYNKSMAYLQDRLKKNTSLKEELNDIPIIDEHYDETHVNEQLFAIENAVNRLSQAKRKIFISNNLEQKTAKQIALQFDIKVSTVKEYLKQCNRIIKSVISKN